MSTKFLVVLLCVHGYIITDLGFHLLQQSSFFFVLKRARSEKTREIENTSDVKQQKYVQNNGWYLRLKKFVVCDEESVEMCHPCVHIVFEKFRQIL